MKGENIMKDFPNKDVFYQFGKDITEIDINKNIVCNNIIIDTDKSLLYKQIDSRLFLNNHYYFIDIMGNCKSNYAKVVVKLFTYLGDKIQEEFVLGVNSSFNIIKIHKKYNSFRIYIFLSGEVDVTINSILVKEVISIKGIDKINNIDLKCDLLDELFDAFDLLSRSVGVMSNDKLISNALKDIWYVRNNYEEIRVLDASSWDNTNNRGYLLSLNGFDNCALYIDVINNIKNNKVKGNVIRHYIRMIEYFIDNNEYVSQVKTLTYNDMAVAKRIHNLIYFYGYFNDYFNIKQKDKVLSLIIHDANLLMENHFNSRGTNHGLYQDIAALTYLYCFNGKYSKYDIKDIARNIYRYFAFAITDEGVLKEHSPAYQVYIIYNMVRILNLFKKLNLDIYDMDKRLENMKCYCVNIMLPNKLLPRIGDGYLKTYSAIHKYIDLSGLEPKDNMVYPESGYAVFRKKNIDKETYVFFYNAYNSFYHKHSDENGLMIYKDREIITEAGANGYQYSDPYTKYAYSSWGHNTLIVNDKGLLEEKNIPNDFNYNGTYIKDYNIKNNNHVYIRGVTERYNDVKFMREVEYNKKDDSVKVTDNVTSKNKNKYTILWNLGVGLDVRQVNNKLIYIYSDDKRVATVNIKSSSKYDISIVKGQTEPRILGWCVNQDKGHIPINVICITFNNMKKFKLVTNFKLDD